MLKIQNIFFYLFSNINFRIVIVCTFLSFDTQIDSKYKEKQLCKVIGCVELEKY